MESKTIGRYVVNTMTTSEGFGADELVARKPNLIENDGVVHLIMTALGQINSAICHTIGPYGSNTIVQEYNSNGNEVFYTTRDGYTLMKLLRFMDPIPKIVYNIIVGVSEFMQNRVGDSTSSGIPITSALYTKLISEYNPAGKSGWKLSPVGVKNILNSIGMYVTENIFPTDTESMYIRRFDKMTEDEIIDELTNVAGISLNNDFETGRKFAEMYRDALDIGAIRLDDETSGPEDEFIKSSGFTIPVSVTDFQKFAEETSTFGNACVLEKPVIIMFDGIILEEDINSIKKLVKVIAFDMKREMLFTAESFSPFFMKLVYGMIDGTLFNEDGRFLDETPVNEQKPIKVKAACVPIRNKRDYDRAIFRDFKIMTNCKGVISTTMTGKFNLDNVNGVENIIEYIENHSGTCERYVGMYSESVLYGCKPNKEKYDVLYKELQEQLERLELMNKNTNQIIISDLRRRIWNLNSKVAIIKIGAPNEAAKRAKRIIYDDAVRSMETAIKRGGVAVGGNIAICHFLENNRESATQEITKRLIESEINLCSGVSFDTLKQHVEKIIDIVIDSFGAAYRYSLFNMFQDEEKAYETWYKCITSSTPTIYNIMTQKFEHFKAVDSKDTSVIVPITTDMCLIEIVLTTVGDLIIVNKMMPQFPPNFKWEDIKYLIRNASNQNNVGV